MKGILIGGLLGLVISAATIAYGQEQVNLDPGEMVTVTCATTGGCPPEPTGHEDHYGRHSSEAKLAGNFNGCRNCHGATLTGGAIGVARGDRVFLSKDQFIGPAACYTSPWQSPSFPPSDPYGRYQFPQEVCTGLPETRETAIYNAGTQISCAHCHNKVKVKDEEVVLR
jgi:hypothetical protein